MRRKARNSRSNCDNWKRTAQAETYSFLLVGCATSAKWSPQGMRARGGLAKIGPLIESHDGRGP